MKVLLVQFEDDDPQRASIPIDSVRESLSLLTCTPRARIDRPHAPVESPMIDCRHPPQLVIGLSTSAYSLCELAGRRGISLLESMKRSMELSRHGIEKGKRCRGGQAEQWTTRAWRERHSDKERENV